MAVDYTMQACANKTDSTLEVTVAAPGNSGYFFVPQGAQLTNVEVQPGPGGTAAVEATLDKTVAEANGTGVEWDNGAVTAASQLTLNGGAYVRLVVSVGSAKMILRANLS